MEANRKRAKVHRLATDELSPTFPFSEGDDYYTIEDNEVVRSCWDDISEELHSINKVYFKTEAKAIEFLNRFDRII